MYSTRIIATVLLMSAGLFSSSCKNAETETAIKKIDSPRPAKIVQVISAGISTMRIYPGTIEASQKAELAFRVDGQLVGLPAKSGDTVKKGDLLARLDEAIYQNIFAERQSRYELAKIQHDQAGKLLLQKLTSQLKYDQAVAEMKSAKAALDLAHDNLEYTQLLAPFDGVVARVGVENHQAIQAKTPIIHLQDENLLEIQFSVPETLISQLIKIEDPRVIENYCGNVRFSAHPEVTFRACHKEHESVPDPLTRNYAATFSLEPITGFATLPGMTATIELDFTPLMPKEQAKKLLIPIEAVFEKMGKKWVWHVDTQMQARQVTVEVGRFEGNMLEITEGLSLHDKIIAAGVSYIHEGMRVKPLIKERGL